MTRQRMYLETMERVLGQVDKVIVDPGTTRQGSGGVLPVLPLNDLLNQKPAAPAASRTTQGGQQ